MGTDWYFDKVSCQTKEENMARKRRRDAFLDAETRELGVKMEMCDNVGGVPPGIMHVES